MSYFTLCFGNRFAGMETSHLSLGTVVYPNDDINIATILIATIASAIAAFLIILSAVFAVKYKKQRRLLKGYNEQLLARIRDLHEGNYYSLPSRLWPNLIS